VVADAHAVVEQADPPIRDITLSEDGDGPARPMIRTPPPKDGEFRGDGSGSSGGESESASERDRTRPPAVRATDADRRHPKGARAESEVADSQRVDSEAEAPSEDAGVASACSEWP
jgi:hypothetical protein